METNRTCGDCAFYAVHANQLDTGNCRSESPSIFMLMTRTGKPNWVTKWPDVKQDSKACSKHRTDLEAEADKPNVVQN